MLAEVPTKDYQSVKSGFVKLLGELHALEKQLISQTKAGEELRGGLLRLPPPDNTLQRLQESEDEYQGHIERLSTRNTTRARRLVEASSRGHMYADRCVKLTDEIEQLREERVRLQAAQTLKTDDGATLEDLRAALEAKSAQLDRLEQEQLSVHKICEENKALKRRLAQLSNETFEVQSAR